MVMDKIDDPDDALRFAKHYGYLQEFITPSDSWFEVGDTPLETDGYSGHLIEDRAAEILIEKGRVVEISRGHPPGDGTTRVICYKPI
jgi:hypothetical protein